MAISKGDVFTICLAKALEDTNDANDALYDNPRVSAVDNKVWEATLVYYDTIWPKLEAVLDAPPLELRTTYNDDN